MFVGDLEVFSKGFGVIDLEAIETCEALHLDELGDIAAVAVIADAEIEGEEMRVIIFIGDAVGIGDGAFCPLFKSGVQDEIDDVFAGVDEQGGEIPGDKNGGLCDPEFDGARISAVEIGQELLILLPGKSVVERSAQGWYHRRLFLKVTFF
jgi:hypothetical protein